jgi:hypothetical protein
LRNQIAIPSSLNGNWRLVKKILIFFFISGIALSPIASFTTVDTEVGLSSPIGLLKVDGNSTSDVTKSQWVINIGGTIDGNTISGGIQIPVYIFIFGIAGGYLRYLYDIATKWREELNENTSGGQAEHRQN